MCNPLAKRPSLDLARVFSKYIATLAPVNMSLGLRNTLPLPYSLHTLCEKLSVSKAWASSFYATNDDFDLLFLERN
jgi:hypothetical protein